MDRKGRSAVGYGPQLPGHPQGDRGQEDLLASKEDFGQAEAEVKKRRKAFFLLPRRIDFRLQKYYYPFIAESLIH